MTNQGIYVDTHSTDAYFNFGVEYFFAAEKRLEAPVFLLWRTKPTLMVGKYQNTYEEIDLPYAEAHNIDVVRRMSGGGTIYTDEGGWQYTFIQRDEEHEIRFQEFMEPVIRALRSLGLPAEFNGRNDILVGGRKISGNAQYKLAGSTVHHGSLLFDTDIEEMVRSTTVDPYKIISKSIRSVRERVTNIRHHLSTDMDAETFREYMVRSILGDGGSVYELTDEDRAECERLADCYFRPWERRYGANPKFSIVKSGHFPSGKVEVRLDVRRGVVTSAAVYGDFFANEQAENLGKSLVGCRFERAALLEGLHSAGMDGAIYGICAEDIVSVLF